MAQEMKERPKAWDSEGSEGSKGRETLVIPRLDGFVSEFTAAAFRRSGTEVVILPSADADTRAARERWTVGGECWPFRVMAGDYMKALEGGQAHRERRFLAPKFSGASCGLNDFGANLRKIFDAGGFESARTASPDLGNFEEFYRFCGPMAFRALWLGLVTAELLDQALLLARPTEKVSGEAEKMTRIAVGEALAILENGNDDVIVRRLEAALARAAIFIGEAAEAKETGPLVGFVGEPFVRFCNLLNNHIVWRIESSGGRVWRSPLTDEVRLVFFRSPPAIQRELAADERLLRAAFEPFWSLIGLRVPNDGWEEIRALGSQWLPDATGLDWAIGAIGRARWLLDRLRVDGLLALFSRPCLLGSSFLAFQQAWKAESQDRPFRLAHASDGESDWSRIIGEYMDKAAQDRDAKLRL
ncbi:MAG: hypothetical protein LBP22_11400 [Deltaproteobacteria bacterium]|jgi:hypothetical protein|nr:hypothetical protein [Deltaproteobacteria bacterium]